MTMTAREFTAELEKAIVLVASGEKEEIRFSTGMLTLNVLPEEQHKITTAYMRMTLNRVPEVKAVGKVSIKTVTDDEGVKNIVITINKNPRRKQLTTDDLEVIERKTREKFAKRLLGFMPNVMHLEGDKRDGAIEGIALYQDMIKKMAEGE
nr:MAG TPA: hypothetical protein [Caudoviricetes sp.]